MVESATVVARATVSRVERPCPTFARVTFRGDELSEFGTPGKTFDQRIKVLFPPVRGNLPRLAAENWYGEWQELAEPDRGALRTYSIRDLRRDTAGTEVVVDFVLHAVPGHTGPASQWASAAAPGDEVLLVGPRSGRFDGGGIEFEPGAASLVLLAGDETAAPAIARILEDASPDLVGEAFIELPRKADRLAVNAPEGVQVHWLGREGAAQGSGLVPSVLRSLGMREVVSSGTSTEFEAELVWETPGFSALGEPLDKASAAGERYYWIAGESRVVTRLRRHLVRDLGVHRSQVAFMGYWREGVAMK